MGNLSTQAGRHDVHARRSGLRLLLLVNASADTKSGAIIMMNGDNYDAFLPKLGNTQEVADWLFSMQAAKQDAVVTCANWLGTGKTGHVLDAVLWPGFEVTTEVL